MKAGSLLRLSAKFPVFVAATLCANPAQQTPPSSPAATPAPASQLARTSAPAGTPRATVSDLSKRIAAVTSAPSPGIAEIASMAEKGVDDAVIKSYVESSAIAYQPTANDIVYLHEHGVSSDIITALIRRGAAIREQRAQAARAAQSQTQPAPANVQTQTETRAAPQAQVATPAPTVNYSYTYPQTYPVYVPSVYPVYSYVYPLPSVSLYSSYACRPYYSYYPVRYYNTCLPRYRFGAGLGYHHTYPRFTFGTSDGYFGRAHCPIR